MKGIIYIILAVLMVSMMPSCKTITKTVVEHDTLTVEVGKTEQVFIHDTVTIDSTKEQIVTVWKYDTIGRPCEVTKVEYRNKYITEKGETQTVEVHDTLYLSQGNSISHEEVSKSKSSAIPLLIIALLIGALIGLIYVKSKNW